MTTVNAKESRLVSLLELYDMHTKYFHNVLDKITEKDAHNRMDTQATHMAWIAGSVVYDRYYLMKEFDQDLKWEHENLYDPDRNIRKDFQYPSVSEYLKAWDKVSPLLRKVLENLDTERLKQAAKEQMPDMFFTAYDNILFSIDRESYCIGQMALYRRLLGYEAMKYF